MNLKDFLNKKVETGEYYWALVIEDGWVQAGIWEVGQEKAEVTSISPPTPWETDEDLLGACDTALSAAVQNLPEDMKEPSKTVFGVPSSWVSRGQIKREYLDKIRRICAELSLEPSGFVVLPEAIAHLFKSEEGSPLNAIVLGLGKEELDVAVFKLGNLVGTASVARSVSVFDDVVEGLARFNLGEVLPSRIVLYDGKEGELEEVRQALLKVSWEDNEKVKFLHTPKVEILNAEKKVLATSLAGASELANVEVVESPRAGYKTYEVSEEAPHEVENVEVPEEKIKPEELGFAIGEDVGVKAPSVHEAPTPEPAPIERPRASLVTALSGIKTGIVGIVLKLIPARISFSKNAYLIAANILVALLLGAFAAWWFLPKATVTVYVFPQMLEESISLVIDTTGTTSDLPDQIVGGLVKVEVAGEKTRNTTGTKTVGERAKGSVKIQNGTASVVNLASGTFLTGPGDLKFLTSQAASISAALSPSNPGTAMIEVAAADIGASYNLSKDESFKVANYPRAEVDAISQEAFSGGSSRDITAVSEEDQKVLEEELTNELVEEAKSRLASTVAGDELLVDTQVGTRVVKKEFSNKVGDEASNLKLSLTLEIASVSVKKDKAYSLAKEKLEEKIPSGYVLREDQLDLRFEPASEKDGKYEFDAFISANLLPEVNKDEIAKQIRGKMSSYAEDYLQFVPGYTRALISRRPRLPGFLGSLPRVAKNIRIEVEGER